MSEEFISTPQEEAPSYLATLVGDDKKFKSVEDLAKAKVFADQTIKDREDENARLREALERKIDTEELLRRAEEPQEARQPLEDRQPDPAREPAINRDDLRANIREAIAEETAQKTAVDNMEKVAAELVKQLGDPQKANEFVAQKASELGVPVSWLQESAARSPKAFFQSVGLSVSPQSTPSPSQSDVNLRGSPDTIRGIAPNSKAYFDNLRETNPREWLKPSTQNQISKAARAVIEAGGSWS